MAIAFVDKQHIAVFDELKQLFMHLFLLFIVTDQQRCIVYKLKRLVAKTIQQLARIYKFDSMTYLMFTR